ncbi:hypothetical protein [Capybara microvirus Cap3_SP_352]|nr:hypothetical protein [Capybara microvirus Cap3_SP_352]
MRRFQKFPPDGTITDTYIPSLEPDFKPDGSVVFVPYSPPLPLSASDVDIPSLLTAGISPQSAHLVDVTPVDAATELQSNLHLYEQFKTE